jgi:hypothetical protein
MHVKNIVEALALELERPRELSPRVLNYIIGNYDVENDAVGAFLADQLPKLEDYELDLILSPVFTPKLTDQAVFAEILGREQIGLQQWPELIQQLVERPTLSPLITPDGGAHLVKLREVTIERYVHRLRLEATIPENLFGLIERLPAGDRPMLKAIARRNAWESTNTATILESYLKAAVKQGVYTVADVQALLELMESRKPRTLSDLVEHIPVWLEALRHQIETAAGPKPFFSQDVERMHGGGRDHRSHDEARLSVKENEFAFLGRLQKVLAA